ncbi:hypothetical protein JB92DRAFT_2582350, partial [Gautieria morchelliformis]
MQMALPKGIPTLKAMSTGNLTCTDNVFVSTELLESIITCTTVPEDQPAKSDHYLVDTTLEVTTKFTVDTPRYNCKQADWGPFNEGLATRLRDSIDRPEPTSEEEFLQQLRAVVDTITETAEEIVPKTKPSPCVFITKRCWTRQLTQLRTDTRRAGRKSYSNRTDPTHEAHDAYKILRNRYALAIKHSKQEHWDDFLEGINQQTLWMAHKYASSDASD